MLAKNPGKFIHKHFVLLIKQRPRPWLLYSKNINLHAFPFKRKEVVVKSIFLK